MKCYSTILYCILSYETYTYCTEILIINNYMVKEARCCIIVYNIHWTFFKMKRRPLILTIKHYILNLYNFLCKLHFLVRGQNANGRWVDGRTDTVALFFNPVGSRMLEERKEVPGTLVTCRHAQWNSSRLQCQGRQHAI